MYVERIRRARSDFTVVAAPRATKSSAKLGEGPDSRDAGGVIQGYYRRASKPLLHAEAPMNDPSLQVSPESYEFVYRLEFRHPCVAISTRTGAVLEVLSDALSKQAVFGAKNIHSRAGPAIGDALIRFELFNGFATLDVTSEYATCTFKGLQSMQDLQVTTNTCTAATDALSIALPFAVIGSERVTAVVTYKIEGGAEARNQFFSRVIIPGLRPGMGQLSIKLHMPTFEGAEDVSNLEIAPLWADAAKLFVYFECGLVPDTKRTLLDRLMTLNNFVVATMTELGMKVGALKESSQ